MSTNILQQHSTHVWVGSQPTTRQKVYQVCIQLFAQNHAQKEQIKNHEHPWITWLDQPYKTANIDDIIQATQLRLLSNEYRIFVFEHAQHMLPSAANRLLKTIEEPHPGYIFIFCTPTPKALLPTITSRSLQTRLEEEQTYTNSAIVTLFTTFEDLEPENISKIIDKEQIKESDTAYILDAIQKYWLEKSSKVKSKKDQHDCMKILTLISKQYTQLPQPGSVKLFWKNMYVSLIATLL